MENNVHENEVLISTILSKIELLKLRKSKKMTQKDVAQKTGLSIKCISDIESSSGNPTLKSIIKYLECLGYEMYFKPKTLLEDRDG